MLTKPRNRGPRDILMCCRDGIPGLLESITTAFVPSLTIKDR
jgi:hypothetical protein